MKHYVYLIFIMGFFSSCGDKLPQLGKSNLDEVIGAMTLEEKVRLTIGTGMAGFSGDSAVVGQTKKVVPGAAGTTYAIPRLGIPSIVMADGPAGLRIDPTRPNDTATYYCTHFPIGTLLASTWDRQLVQQVGAAIGNEVLEYGADILLAPALNIQRNPLCGRNFEYYSEDPVLSGLIAASYVNGVQSNGVGTSIKHFAGNNQESNRMGMDARVSQRALREIYLKGFELAVKESDPWTLMSSYNYLNGIYTSENQELLTTLLREEWGYKGMVVTDWFGGKDAVAQMIAGNDMLQPGLNKQYEDIITGVKEGQLSEKILDRNVKRILELILRTPRFKGYNFSNKPDLKAHAAITRQSATEGMVLLKNESDALPFNQDINNVSLFGCTSYDFIAGGTGSGNVNRAYTVSLPDGLKKAGYQINDELKQLYLEYLQTEKSKAALIKKDKMSMFLPQPRPAEMQISRDLLLQQASCSDIGLITIGRTSGEFLDRRLNDFSLTSEELDLIRNVSKVFHEAGKKVIVVLNIGGVIETASWKDFPDAILLAWQPGQEGGNSVADILSGKVSPSGKLTMTFPVYYEEIASSANFPLDGAMSSMDFTSQKELKGEQRLWDYTDYEEDIYVGYRFFDSFDKHVSYPFGYGLSYTTFEYGNPTIRKTNKNFIITLDVKNTGKEAGKEVVQLYVSAPNNKAENKPVKELKAFLKTDILNPGEVTTVTLSVDSKDLASYDETSSSWCVSPGNYLFHIASSAADIKATLNEDVMGSRMNTNDILQLKNTIVRQSR